MEQPLVTVIALCFNHEAYVIEMLESIRHQSYSHIQLIIVDDCSRDNSVKLIQAWQAKQTLPIHLIIHQTNQGICKSINEGLTFAKGKFVAIVATDDVWLPNKLESQLKAFESISEDYGVVFSDAYRIDSKGVFIPTSFMNSVRSLIPIPQGNILDSLLDGNFISAPSALIRRSCFEKIGLYDEKLSYEDWDMWVRIAYHYQFYYDSNILTKYRITPNSLTQNLLNIPNTKRHQSDFYMFQKWLKSFELSNNQKDKVIKLLKHSAYVLSEQQHPHRRKYLFTTLKHDFCYLTLYLLFLSFIPLAFRKRINSFKIAFQKLLNRPK